MTVDPPQVSVVIPTHKRPELVLRAVRSVLAQSFSPYEVIVVSDGPDELTATVLGAIGDSRVRYLVREKRGGPAAAKNTGIAAAAGDWVAFLDDDDWWTEAKLERQVGAWRSAGSPLRALLFTLTATVRGGATPEVLASEDPTGVKDISTYMFGHDGLRKQGKIHTSSLMVPRSFFEKVTFREDLSRHEDWEWILDVDQAFAPTLICVQEPLVMREPVPAGRAAGFEFSRDWYMANRARLSSEARLGFLSGPLARKAGASGDWSAVRWVGSEFAEVGGSLRLPLLFRLGTSIVRATVTRLRSKGKGSR